MSQSYPHPKMSIQEKDDTAIQYFREIDLGEGERTFDDGRPSLIQNWRDCDYGLFCRTFFYSTTGIENWDQENHREYLLKNEVGPVKGDLGIRKLNDDNGAELWSVTVVLGKDED